MVDEQTEALRRALANLKHLRQQMAMLAKTAKGKEARVIAKGSERIVNRLADGIETIALVLWGNSKGPNETKPPRMRKQ